MHFEDEEEVAIAVHGRGLALFRNCELFVWFRGLALFHGGGLIAMHAWKSDHREGIMEGGGIWEASETHLGGI